MRESAATATTKSSTTTTTATRDNPSSKLPSPESAVSTTSSSPPKFPRLLFHEAIMTSAVGGEQERHNKTRNKNRVTSHRCCSSLWFWCHKLMEQIRFGQQHPYTVLGSFMLFAVMLTFGLYLSYYFKGMELDTIEDHALSAAEETALLLSNELDAAVAPLYSLAHFVSEITIFSQLEDSIGYIGTADALPMISATHRNVTGVCDEPNLVQRFNKIAQTLKSTATRDGILINLQLVPDAVVCLLYPLNNTEDFGHGKYLDSSGVVGHDLLADPDRRYMTEATLAQSKLVVDGPIILRQCPDCHPTVTKAFIARLPINSLKDDHLSAVTINQADRYGKWGFAVALIHWENLVARSGIYESYDKGSFEFQLTRTDRVFNDTTAQFDENTIVLAESSEFASANIFYRVQTTLPTSNNEWEVSVAYCTGDTCLGWLPWAITASVLISLFISLLVYTIFMQKQRHSDLIEEKSRQMVQAAKRMARNERELNDFIAHEVRNPISAALAACSFVSAAVNETQPLVDFESRRNVRDDVVIIESSLKYANDLLHSMLDLNRGNTEITVRLLPTDIKRDILEPVASMTHRRDPNSSFEVLIECIPDSLIVSVDRLRLKQIVLNLVRNSSRYVQAGGFVRLRAKVLEEAVADDGERTCTICISVEDSGPGVPLDKQESLFKKCQTSVGGAGIGLSLCQKMVDMMDASISLDKEYRSGVPGMMGAKFDVCLQCRLIKADTDVASDGVASTTSGGSSQSRSSTLPSPIELPDHAAVLFVDDDNVLRKLFARSLRRICPDWTIVEASSGENALQVCQEEGSSFFDIIFIDQYMSTVEQSMLGTETTRQMRIKGVTSIICGLSANDMQDAFQAVGADFFMHKPFPCEPNVLRESMFRILTGPRNTQWSSTSTIDV